MIRELTARDGDLVLDADVCVIGSGAGGAVVAAEIAAAGHRVVVLEQGPHWTSSDFTQREDEMLPKLFEEGGMRQTADGSVLVLQGRNIGGSTVHNLCYAFRTPDPILALWREEHGLEELTPQAMEPSFARVERQLKIKQIHEAELNVLNRKIRDGARALGYSGFVTRHNREGCIGAGYCLLGCSYDAKQSMLVTYIPKADAAGAQIYACARASRIEASGGRAQRVLGQVIDRHGEEGASIEVRANTIVVSAGAVATPDLLLRSGIVPNPQLGANLHLHPSVLLAGFWEEPIHAYRGIPQSYYIDEFIDLEKNPHAGYVLMPISGFPGLSAVNLPGFGSDHFASMQRFAHMGGLLVLLHDRSQGHVAPGSDLARPELHYALRADDAALLAEGMVHCAKVLFAAGARQVVVPYLPEALLLERGDDLAILTRRGVELGKIALASTHPQSTCRMGDDPKHAVVDAFGECFDVSGLFVADMSVFPTSLGAPPQVTTAALADRTAHHILSRLS